MVLPDFRLSMASWPFVAYAQGENRAAAFGRPAWGEKMREIAEDLPSVRLAVCVDRNALAGRGRGIFFVPAEGVSAQDVNEMARSGRGLVAAAMTAERAFTLGLMPLAQARSDSRVRYLVSVEAVACAETGISASERALTLRTLAAHSTTAVDLVSPGHIMPSIVATRIGPESELQELAFHAASAHGNALAIAWCDILDDAGDVASAPWCEALAVKLGLVLLVRRGDALVEAAMLDRSMTDPVIRVGVGGLDLGQFA